MIQNTKSAWASAIESKLTWRYHRGQSTTLSRSELRSAFLLFIILMMIGIFP